jgi:DNA helicase-2/ATP-dependent DNA helicase PcrA
MQNKFKLVRLNQSLQSQRVVDESKFIINYKHQLNEAQYEAASATEGSFLIIAGAGTGKTRTLVFRVARLIEMGYDPESILLLTFTRKAANEMMNRASLLLDRRCSKIIGGTFHSYANSILRKYAKAVGIESSFTILDQGDSEDVINLIRSRAGLVSKEKRFPKKQTLNKIFSLSANTYRTVEDIVADEYPHFFNDLEKIEEIKKVFVEYKRKNNLLDYDDLLVYLKDFLFTLSPSAKSILQSINFVMVDEYQDTNKLQAELVRALTQLKKNIMVVGDDAQSIYSFRGANFKNIMEFPKLFEGTKIIKLEENYRSSPEILSFANKITEAAIEKYEKELYTKLNPGVLPIIIAATTENLQSRFIVEKILELHEEGIPLKDIAVLFRSSFFSFDLEIELNKANIPFVKFGGMKFVETAHIKDILAILRITLNPRDFVSWYRILLLHDGVGPKSAQNIMDDLANANISIQNNPESLAKNKLLQKVYPLFELLYKLHNSKALPSEKAQIALEFYYPLFKSKYDDFNKRKKDLDIFINISENYKSLENLLADMAIEPPIDSVVDIEGESKEDDYVTLSTIHSAKGLEWNSVFIIHAVDGFFPMSRLADKIENIEEERRLMYVAATRAKQNLIITYPMNIFDREAGTTLSKPSRFIADISEDYFENWLLEE